MAKLQNWNHVVWLYEFYAAVKQDEKIKNRYQDLKKILIDTELMDEFSSDICPREMQLFSIAKSSAKKYDWFCDWIQVQSI